MPKQPQDHQTSEFTHKFADGDTVTLPRFGSLMTFGRVRKMRHLPEAEQMFLLMEEVCDEDQLAVLDKMDTAETQEFFSGWQKHSGVDLGE